MSQLPQQGGTLKSACVASLLKLFEGQSTLGRWLRQVVAATSCAWWTAGLGRSSFLPSSTVASVFTSQQLKDQHPEEVACQLFLEGKKQRVVNIVTVAWLATAGLRGGQILEASSSTCSASHTLLPSASAAPPRVQDSVKGLASRKECRLVSRRSCTVLNICEMELPFHVKL